MERRDKALTDAGSSRLLSEVTGGLGHLLFSFAGFSGSSEGV